MKVQDAVRLANSLTYRPGWTISATASMRPGHIVVTYDVDTVDTSYPDANGRYARPRFITVDYIIDVTGLGTDTLMYQIYLGAHERVDEHEDREFFRVQRPDGSWYAPFHPHDPDRAIRYEVAKGRATSEVTGIPEEAVR